MSVKIDEIEYNGVSYITNDIRGTWVWEVKPVLEKDQWVLPEEYRGKPGMTLLMNQVNGSVLPTLLNSSGKDFNTTLEVFNKPRIFKIVLENIEE